MCRDCFLDWHQDADQADPIQRRSELREHGWGEIIRAGTAKLPAEYKSQFTEQMEKCKETDFDKDVQGIVKKHCVYMMHTMERELDLHFLDAIFFRNAWDFEDAEWSRLIDERSKEFGITTEEAFEQLKAMKLKHAETASAAKACTKMAKKISRDEHKRLLKEAIAKTRDEVTAMLPDHREKYDKMVAMLNKYQADNHELLQREGAAAKAQAVALDAAMLYQSNVARFTGFVTALGHNVGWTPDGYVIIEKAPDFSRQVARSAPSEGVRSAGSPAQASPIFAQPVAMPSAAPVYQQPPFRSAVESIVPETQPEN